MYLPQTSTIHGLVNVPVFMDLMGHMLAQSYTHTHKRHGPCHPFQKDIPAKDIPGDPSHTQDIPGHPSLPSHTQHLCQGGIISQFAPSI